VVMYKTGRALKQDRVDSVGFAVSNRHFSIPTHLATILKHMGRIMKTKQNLSIYPWMSNHYRSLSYAEFIEHRYDTASSLNVIS
jgi:hypothetical protein